MKLEYTAGSRDSSRRMYRRPTRRLSHWCPSSLALRRRRSGTRRTNISDDELRLLWFSTDYLELRFGFVLGMNCVYRESDILSLRAAEIETAKREIIRVRTKTKRFSGVPECHRLRETITLTIRPWLERSHDSYPFARFKYLSIRLTQYIDATIPGNADLPYGELRTAQSIRSTASRMLEDITEGYDHLVKQMLRDRDHGISKHYTRQDIESLFKVIDRMKQRLGL